MARIQTITRFYIRHYRDNEQTVAYCEWTNARGKAGRTEGNEHTTNGCLCCTVRHPEPGVAITQRVTQAHFSLHMEELARRAIREGLTIETEVW